MFFFSSRHCDSKVMCNKLYCIITCQNPIFDCYIVSSVLEYDDGDNIFQYCRIWTDRRMYWLYYDVCIFLFFISVREQHFYQTTFSDHSRRIRIPVNDFVELVNWRTLILITGVVLLIMRKKPMEKIGIYIVVTN